MYCVFMVCLNFRAWFYDMILCGIDYLSDVGVLNFLSPAIVLNP